MPGNVCFDPKRTLTDLQNVGVRLVPELECAVKVGASVRAGTGGSASWALDV